MKLIKFQKIFAIVPFWSTYVIIFITMFCFAKNGAKIGNWVKLFISMLVIAIIAPMFLVEVSAIVRYIVMYFVFLIVSFYLISLQVKVRH